ncbi:hypothetical protein PQ456_16090 [Paenibacillus kyungheensis]|uniref:Uncharacterized protein n=1 Tax=Paenibacillus kyungheensis TaxID=1452732 RepID=A0AAX3LXV7_9BACL|nr:hypothetical protein [Paenibacillus kyungheensis]WCT54710.1 hypothetical protein PQ456_16090 [Paenibacillus kyungheensis]
MSNSISLPPALNDSVESIGMSNGLTSVFVEVLSISGSLLAQTNREKELTIWIAQRDQSVVGMGTVSFDIDEMPWMIEHFAIEKSFILKVILKAIDGLGWEKLSYQPQPEFIISCLQQFYSMIEVFNEEHVDIKNYLEWAEIEEGDDRPTIPIGYPKCEKHDIYITCHGCVLCNSES